jgi:NAD dependent epimerase/dehydratase
MTERVLVTGAGGFIGSHLVDACAAAGRNVRAFVHYNSRGARGWLDRERVPSNLEVVAGDVRDYDSVFAAMKGCSTVFHLAALIGIPYSYVSPLAYVNTNITGTYNVLQSAREQGATSVVVTSTSETYGTAKYVPMDESHPLAAQSPYAASKIAADQLALSYFRSFGLPVKVARPFNTFGPRQSARAIIPAIIVQLLAGKKEISLGSISPTRDFTFVEDTALGFLEIARTERFVGEVVNIGNNSEISVLALAQLIAKVMGVDVSVVCDKERIRPEQSEVDRLRCDPARLMTGTAWKPRYSLEEGLAKTIGWIRDNRIHYKSDIYNI